MATGEVASRNDAAAPSGATEFTEWVRPHWSAMHALAHRMSRAGTGEDVLQESLADAWRHRLRFDPARGQVRAWLLTIVANQARRSFRGVPRADRLTDEIRVVDGDAAQIRRIDMATALRRLTERQRLAVTLHYYLGLTTAECAEVMSCSTGTVKSTLSDARGRLRILLRDADRD
ncbi:RNA polymerase sigma factor [uncultured Jatrophihabitans sp.]|uniref:RNA polymerase sigma factor n=1 Tax=uncultured Jatrophihabitans sp. TaxID=1610747 RepID=UPI0035CB644D